MEEVINTIKAADNLCKKCAEREELRLQMVFAEDKSRLDARNFWNHYGGIVTILSFLQPGERIKI